MSQTVTYFDHAATTPADPQVVQAMTPYFTVHFGNPSSTHRLGLEAHRALDEARRTLAQAVGCRPTGVFFTAGGTEADVIAIRGAVGVGKRERHLVVTAIEHNAVLTTAKSLEKSGNKLSIVPATREGLIEVDAFVDAVTPETVFASIMAVNNELGTIQPIGDISRRVKEKAPKCVFHVDAVQAFGRLPVGFTQWPEVDCIAISAHKIYGPKGTGALFLKDPGHLDAILTGGGQEGGLRSGTQNVAGAVALSEAYKLSYQRRATDRAHYQDLNERLLELLEKKLPEVMINGPRDEGRVPYTINLRFPAVPAEPLLNGLEGEGFLVSSGSACHSKSGTISHVLAAIGLKDSDGGSIRVSFGRSNKVEDVDHFVDSLCTLVPRLKTVAQGA